MTASRFGWSPVSRFGGAHSDTAILNIYYYCNGVHTPLGTWRPRPNRSGWNPPYGTRLKIQGGDFFQNPDRLDWLKMTVLEKLCNQPGLSFFVQSPLWDLLSRTRIDMRYHHAYSNYPFDFNRLDRNHPPDAEWDDIYFVSDDVDDPLWDVGSYPTIRLSMDYEFWLDFTCSSPSDDEDDDDDEEDSD